MADYTGTLLASVGDVTSGDLNAEYDGVSVNLTLLAPVYRGRVGGEYVYSLGSIPSGATDVVIVRYT